MNRGTTFTETETILTLLRSVERRIRTHRLAHELTLGFCIALIFPIVLKIWDLYSPLQMRTVAGAAFVCAVLFMAYAVWRLFPRETIDHAAVSVDSRAGLHDQMATACWFIANGPASDWIDAQFRGAARAAAGIDVHRLYPRIIPRTSCFAATLVVLFVGLNFVPLSLNHNWLKLQAAPAGIPPDLADREEEVDNPPEQVAEERKQTGEPRETAGELLRKELQKAADELRKLARQLAGGKPESPEHQQAQKNGLKQAANDPKNGGEAMREQESEGQKGQDGQKGNEGKDRQPQGASRKTAAQQGEKETRGTGQRGRATEKKSESENDGTGEDPNGKAPRTGEPTSLEVQLEQERVAAMPSGGSVPEDVEEISRQQLSKLEYRNLKSQISGTRKDLLNQDGIPWEYRPLIKNYFLAIRPADGPDAKKTE